jgi:hypothetical protein
VAELRGSIAQGYAGPLGKVREIDRQRAKLLQELLPELAELVI